MSTYRVFTQQTPNEYLKSERKNFTRLNGSQFDIRLTPRRT